MIAAGSEMAALGPVLREAAKVAMPARGASPTGRLRRADAYSDLQRSAVEVLARIDTVVSMQEAVPENRWLAVAATYVGGVGVLDRTGSEFGKAMANAVRPLSLALLTRALVERFDAQRSQRADLATFNSTIGRLLGALTDVRLVGGHEALAAAENLVSVVGEVLAAIPIMEDRALRRTLPSTGRYDKVRLAAMYHIRMFGAVARQDLSAWPWRRRTRRRKWQFYRPRPPDIGAVDVDVEKLLEMGDLTD